MGLKENLEKRETSTLYDIMEKDDKTEWQEKETEIAKEILEERGEDLPEQQIPKNQSTETAEETSPSNDEKSLTHKIISGPILSGQDELEEKLNELGKSGWVLVDTQRHSIAGKQHAVCFLRKALNKKLKKQNEKLDKISDKLEELLVLQKGSVNSLDEE